MDKYFDGELLSGFEESPKTTTSRYEQLGYCEYRDVKTGLVASNYIEVMNQQSNRIADLEAKLAKSDMEVFMLTKNNDCYKSDIAQLKHQLIEECKEHQEFCKVADEKVKELKQQLADTQNEKDKIEEENQNLTQCIEELKQQLAEKEKEETKRMEDFEKGCQEYYKSNQTAIDELKKAKEWVDKMYDGWKTNQEIHPYQRDGISLALENVGYKLDQQIRVLKGEE